MLSTLYRKINSTEVTDIINNNNNNNYNVQLYDNGYLGVGSTTGGKTSSPFPFSSISPMIAAYWADVDTTNLGTVYYRETRDSDYLDAVRDEIRAVYGGTFAPTSLFIATWDKVGYCCSNTGPEVATIIKFEPS